jgi:putative phosphoesterase
MKIFFLSDVHGAYTYLTKALECFEKEGADYLAFLGDALYHGPRNPLPNDYDPGGTAELLNHYQDKIIAVRGNCDSEVDQMMIAYPMLADYAVALAANRRIFLTHGHLYNPEHRPALTKGDIFAFGHTHIPVAIQHEDIYLFNPGSITFPKDKHPNSYGIYDEHSLMVKGLSGETVLSLTISK